jgi:6-phosphogluconolactonase
MNIISRSLAVLLMAALPAMIGCKGFFIPTCQEDNNCSSTTTTTGTTGTTGTPGTGSGGTTDPITPSYAYVANAQDGTIRSYSVSGMQASSQSTSSVTIPGTSPTAVAAAPNGNLLFAATGDGSILNYKIAPGGALQAAHNSKPMPNVPGTTSMMVDPSGTLLFVLSASSSQLSGFRVDTSTGNLTPIAGGTVAVDSGEGSQIAITPDDQHLFVALGAGGVDAFSLDAGTGTVTNRMHLATRAPGKNLDTAFASDDAQHIYVAESGAGIRVFSIDSGGALAEISGSPFATQAGAASSLMVNPAGTVLYAAYPASSAIEGYAIGSSGALASISKTPFSVGGSATALSLDAYGESLLAVSGDSVVETFRFDGTALDAAQ